ncbi:MAG TPA: N-acetylmuramoyl-L-alanine amidase family protein, partial [Clostridia bacterium]|nr:N-acetylmuramoyl-L-alanine amidase family protein [Clostridia bacterium]
LVTISKKAAITGGLYVLGKKINSADLPYVKNNIVYIPLRRVGEALGYQVSWAASVETMDLKSAGGSAKVTIGYGTGVVNGKNVKISPVPIMHNERAYVPISFIQNNFDFDVNYDKAKNIVNIDKKKPPVVAETKPKEEPIEYKPAKIDDIIYDDSGGFPQLNIVADNPVKYKSSTIVNPARMVVDIENSQLNTEFETREIGKGGVIRVRVSQFSTSPNVVRVVIDLEDQTRCKLVQSNDKKTVSLIYANIINPVSFAKEGDRDVLMIRGTQDMETNVFKLEGPDRLVVDIYKSVLSESQTVDTKTPYVKAIRTGQADVGVARVVLDLEPGMYYDYETQGSLTKVYVSNIPFSFFDYKKYYSSAFIDLSPGAEVEYQPIMDNDSRTLKIMIPKDLEVEQKVYEINDNIMEQVEVTKETYGDMIYTVAAFKMKPSVEFELLSPAVTKLVSVKFKEKAERSNQLTVLIDPGHGGKDPGAKAIDKKTNEKDLNLDVALRLNRILKDLGFNTMMTRTDDRYVDLASRSGMANSNYVDFFMSIHFNAFTNSAKGIETLYYPNEITDEYPIDNRKMAELFHSEIIDALKRPSRGITPRPGLHVLNKTKMPAILAELGFITNVEEFNQIKKSEYKEMAARALAASIVKFYQEIEQINLDIDVDAIYAAPIPPNPYSLETAKQNTAADNLVTEQIPAQDEMLVTE